MKGRKRTIAVDSAIRELWYAANIADCVGGEMLVDRLARREYPRLEVVMGDSSYVKVTWNVLWKTGSGAD